MGNHNAAPSRQELELAYRTQCYTDFEFFAEDNLWIRPKPGDLIHLKLNRAQAHVHQAIEQQYRQTGKVRAIILKGRQQGCSTYIEGRFYWKTSHRRGVRAFILAHDGESTSNLFSMAKRYYDHCPVFMRPVLQSSNARELQFKELDSGYRIGTAGNESVGRSQTNQYFHGSEVAFWDNAGELVKGILQTVPDMAETEVIYESTANGQGGFFHQQCLMAMRGEGDFIFVFVPWYWQEEYTRPLPDDWERSDLEEQYMLEYGPDGCTDEHLCWRRAKIIELTADRGDGETAFKQEYPFNATEAFQYSGEYGLIHPDLVREARNATDIQPSGPLVVGIDPSRGGDPFGVMRRQGRVMYGNEAITGKFDLGRKVSVCKKILDTEEPARMFIDAGEGADLVDRLRELGYENVRAVSFGGKAMDPERYPNKRNEMYGEMLNWFAAEDLPVSIPDDDGLQMELCASQYKRDSHDRKVLEAKEDLKKRLGFSPGQADAAALTFAEPVRDDPPMHSRRAIRAHRGIGRR